MQTVASCEWRVVSTGSGWAHETHFTPVIFGSADQQAPQQEAVRSRHGSSRWQATHHDGRTILSASRPTNDKAFVSVLRTRAIVRSTTQLA